MYHKLAGSNTNVNFSGVPDTKYKSQAFQERGELGGKAVLTCSLSLQEATIKYVQWMYKRGTELVPVYVDFSEKNTNATGPQGIFSGRNVTGYFNKQNTSHSLVIFETTSSDRGVYACPITTNNGDVYEYMVTLNIVGK